MGVAAADDTAADDYDDYVEVEAEDVEVDSDCDDDSHSSPPPPPPPLAECSEPVEPVDLGPLVEATNPPIGTRVRVHWAKLGREFDGSVVDIRTELTGARGATSYRFQVAYDDGDRRWHGAGEYGEYKVMLLPPEATAEADVVCTEEPWEKLELRCAISLQRLADPAKGRRCTHGSRCNFDMLRAHAARAKVCPIVGCDAPLARTHEVQRDDACAPRSPPSQPPSTSCGGAARGAYHGAGCGAAEGCRRQAAAGGGVAGAV